MFRLQSAKKRHWAEPSRGEGTRRERARVRESVRVKSWMCHSLSTFLPALFAFSLSLAELFGYETTAVKQEQTARSYARTCWSLQVAKKRVFLTPKAARLRLLPFRGPGIYIHLMHARVRFAWCATFAVGCSPPSSLATPLRPLPSGAAPC